MENFINEARKLYKRLGKDTPYSPLLKGSVNFTKYGWRHLTRGNERNRRTKEDALSRMFLLLYVEEVITSDIAKVVRSTRGKREFISLEQEIGSRIIVRVIIEVTRTREYKFYSVMEVVR